MTAPSCRYDLSSIMRKAHAEARLVAKPGRYREVFALRLRQQWKNDKADRYWTDELRRQQAGPGHSASFEARCSTIMEIETNDRLTSADFALLAELRSPQHERRPAA